MTAAVARRASTPWLVRRSCASRPVTCDAAVPLAHSVVHASALPNSRRSLIGPFRRDRVSGAARSGASLGGDATSSGRQPKSPLTWCLQIKELEAAPGIEPGYRALQYHWGPEEVPGQGPFLAHRGA